MDARSDTRGILEKLEFSSAKALQKAGICLILALLVAFIPQFNGLSLAARRVLFILILAAGLWISEAIPAFAVAVLIIALEIALLGRPGGVFATTDSSWQIFVQPWSSPLLWLFFWWIRAK